MAAIRDNRRRGGKAVAAVAPARCKMSASVRAETYMRLATHALWTGKTQGELIDEMVAEHCRRFQVRDMGSGKRPDDVDDRPDLADGASESDEPAAA